MTRISLVIPCYNEEDAIPVFLSRVAPIMEATGHDFEMLFVDDGSRDKTMAVFGQLSVRISVANRCIDQLKPRLGSLHQFDSLREQHIRFHQIRAKNQISRPSVDRPRTKPLAR